MYLNGYYFVLLVDLVVSHVDHFRQDEDATIVFAEVGRDTSDLAACFLLDIDVLALEQLLQRANHMASDFLVPCWSQLQQFANRR
jgi:hypothetical protein